MKRAHDDAVDFVPPHGVRAEDTMRLIVIPLTKPDEIGWVHENRIGRHERAYYNPPVR